MLLSGRTTPPGNPDLLESGAKSQYKELCTKLGTFFKKLCWIFEYIDWMAKETYLLSLLQTNKETSSYDKWSWMTISHKHVILENSHTTFHYPTGTSEHTELDCVKRVDEDPDRYSVWLGHLLDRTQVASTSLLQPFVLPWAWAFGTLDITHVHQK